MSIFNIFKEKTNTPPFDEINSMQTAAALAEKDLLEPLYLMPLRFGGEKSAANRLFVPCGVSRIKDGFDDIVESLLIDGKVSKYNCGVEYKGKSVIPSRLKITASSSSGEPVFQQTINVW